LRDWLDERTDTVWVSSVLAEIESFRALARYAPGAARRLHPVPDLIELIDLGPRVHVLAQTVGPVMSAASMRSTWAPRCTSGPGSVRSWRITSDCWTPLLLRGLRPRLLPEGTPEGTGNGRWRVSCPVCEIPVA
jgi:hypothetical protein